MINGMFQHQSVNIERYDGLCRVLHFDLSGGKHMEKDQLERYLGFILEMEEKRDCELHD